MDITINATGELRNAAGVASLREYLLVTGGVTNAGTIESIGGEMEFQGAVTNDQYIVARDAILRFNGGLTNAATGDIVLGGETTIYSSGGIVSEGDIHVLSDSEALIVGDLAFGASSTLSLSIGPAAGTLDVVGMVDLGSLVTTLELDYSAGVASQEGDSYQILSSTEPIMGMFSNPSGEVTADGRIWDIMGYGTNTLFVTAVGVAPTVDGDFDADDDVDGFDFLVWQRGFTGIPQDITDLADWEMNYGTPAPLVAAATTGAVPEPSSLALLLLGSVLIAGRRSRNAS